MKHYLASTLLAACMLSPTLALAQMDEIIVTATKRSSSFGYKGSNVSPGITLDKKGNFLLLEVEIENDSRDISERLTQISEAVDLFITAAEDQPDIELSIIDENDFVRPLSQQNYREGIRLGSRPDTSVAVLKVKTEIPDQIQDSYKIAKMLGEFVDSVEAKGRNSIMSSDEVMVSVVDPSQYRPELQAKIIEEINRITDGLGPDYRVILRGLDAEMKWVRSGDLNLAFYIPYTYDIIPNTLHSYKIEFNEDY